LEARFASAWTVARNVSLRPVAEPATAEETNKIPAAELEKRAITGIRHIALNIINAKRRG
jgi:hypothetical protein